ncbi:hypothetical protein [Allofustis seminis]|uniref:hypothetical protein n=1 Tax=Allofustis seminis TaxID=166939 RepID=UPI00036AB577|nr:hypothetical protein [Allofustis seminis]
MLSVQVKDIEMLLLESDITSYKIHKETGIPHQTIDNYRTNGCLIENMRLHIALRLQDYINKNRHKIKDI